MFVVIGISSAGIRWPLGSPTTSLDEAKRIAEKFFEDDKIKGRGIIHQVEIIDKTGTTVFSPGTSNSTPIFTTAGPAS
jgi:hypothetical protein